MGVGGGTVVGGSDGTGMSGLSLTCILNMTFLLQQVHVQRKGPVTGCMHGPACQRAFLPVMFSTTGWHGAGLVFSTKKARQYAGPSAVGMGSVGIAAVLVPAAIVVAAMTTVMLSPVAVLAVAATVATLAGAIVLVAAVVTTAITPFATGTAVLVTTILVIAALAPMVAVAAMPATVVAMTAVAIMFALPTALVLVRRLGLGCQRKGDAKGKSKQN